MASHLSTELARAHRWHKLLAFVQNILGELVIFTGIVCSGLAAVVADAPRWDPALKAIIAAVPGAALLFERQFRYRMRSAWHQEYKVRLRGLERQLRDEGADETEVSHRLTGLDLDMRKMYPRGADEGVEATSADPRA